MKTRLSPTGRLKLLFVICTALILLAAIVIAVSLEYTLLYLDVIDVYSDSGKGWHLLLIFTGTSIVVGLLLSFFIGRILFKPIKKLTVGMSKLSNGEFSTRVDLGKYESMRNLATSFNTLASELENTEMLRSDFVNDFAHEIKTPIVSISGLISLMKNENLDDEKRKRYLEIMEEEANRLTHMTSSTLYLSKIEKQAILTNTTKYNVSEQIRDSLLLLERKWEKKSLLPSIDIDEYYITANEEMIKEVWLNLIDNAIKFADEGSELKIEAAKVGESLAVSITNTGVEIPESEYDLIFTKFYQSDKSRSSDGNGIGLSIVKKILALHNATVSVVSRERKTAFTVCFNCATK